MSAAVLVGAGLLGGLGCMARVLVDDAVMEHAGIAFPRGILIVNLTGSLALGLAVGAGVDGDALRLLGLGLLGGYTTFSSWMLDTGRMAGDGFRGRAAANVGLSLTLGLAAAWLGRELGGLL